MKLLWLSTCLLLFGCAYSADERTGTRSSLDPLGVPAVAPAPLPTSPPVGATVPAGLLQLEDACLLLEPLIGELSKSGSELDIAYLRDASVRVSSILTDQQVIGIARSLKLFVDTMDSYFGSQATWKSLPAPDVFKFEYDYNVLAISPMLRVRQELADACGVVLPHPGDYSE